MLMSPTVGHRTPATSMKSDPQARAGGRRCGSQSALVRDRLTCDQQCVAAPVQGFTNPEFKRAQFVATESQRHGVVALHVKCLMANLGTNPMELFQRCRVVDQPNSGEVIVWHVTPYQNFPGEDGLWNPAWRSESMAGSATMPVAQAVR